MALTLNNNKMKKVAYSVFKQAILSANPTIKKVSIKDTEYKDGKYNFITILFKDANDMVIKQIVTTKSVKARELGWKMNDYKTQGSLFTMVNSDTNETYLVFGRSGATAKYGEEIEG